MLEKINHVLEQNINIELFTANKFIYLNFVALGLSLLNLVTNVNLSRKISKYASISEKNCFQFHLDAILKSHFSQFMLMIAAKTKEFGC